MRRLRESDVVLHPPPDPRDHVSGQVDREVREYVRTAVREQNLVRGGDCRDDAEELVTEWIAGELCKGSIVGWEDQVATAASLGLEVYAHFVRLFEDHFSAEHARGESFVVRALRRRFGVSDKRMIDAALERIRGVRRHLLDRFRRRYQSSMFAPCTVQWSRVPGYFARVAEVESRKLPFDVLPWNATTDADWARMADPRSEWRRTEYEEPSAYYHEMACKLRAFWCEANGFSRPQQWEGMVSAALGFLTDNANVVRRALDYLQQRLPAWEEQHDRLRQRASQLLRRRDHLRCKLRTARDPQLRRELQEKLARMDVRAFRLQLKIALHPRALRPRPGTVRKILGPSVPNPSGVRNRRVKRERVLMHERVMQGGVPLLSVAGGALPADRERLVWQVLQHLSVKLESRSEHNLSDEERQRRTDLYASWMERCVELFGEVRTWLQGSSADCSSSEPMRAVLWSWLADSEDLFCFGVLSKKGILEALGRRHGRRLRHLLRAGRKEK